MIRQFAALAFSLAALVAQAQDFSKAEIKTQQLDARTYLLMGVGGNIGLSVGDDAVFIIDDQYAQMAPKIQAAIAAITKKPVQFVLNTHFHVDHTGGNEAMGKAGALIVAHDNVRRRLSTDQLISFVSARQPGSPAVALPVITVAADISFYINGDEVYAFHAPKAHTDGDLIVHFRKSDIVHMGDTYFNGFYPFIDTSSGGTADGVIAAADRVLTLASDKTKIIPGHGPLSNKTELQAYRNMLADVSKRIKDLRRAGKSEDEIRAAKPAAEYDARLGGGFIKADRFVQMMMDAVPK